MIIIDITLGLVVYCAGGIVTSLLIAVAGHKPHILQVLVWPVALIALIVAWIKKR